MNFSDAIKSALNNYFNFSGRARRSEYWLFQIAGTAISLLLSFSFYIMGNSDSTLYRIIQIIYAIIIFIPTWSIQFRRLHDIDRTAWWLLIALIPIIGIIVLVVFECTPGTVGPNRFGRDPKQKPNEEITEAEILSTTRKSF